MILLSLLINLRKPSFEEGDECSSQSFNYVFQLCIHDDSHPASFKLLGYYSLLLNAPIFGFWTFIHFLHYILFVHHLLLAFGSTTFSGLFGFVVPVVNPGLAVCGLDWHCNIFVMLLIYPSFICPYVGFGSCPAPFIVFPATPF